MHFLYHQPHDIVGKNEMSAAIFLDLQYIQSHSQLSIRHTAQMVVRATQNNMIFNLHSRAATNDYFGNRLVGRLFCQLIGLKRPFFFSYSSVLQYKPRFSYARQMLPVWKHNGCVLLLLCIRTASAPLTRAVWNGRTFMQKWKCSHEFLTFIEKDMTVNLKFLRWGRTRICQSAWQDKPLR